MLMIVSNAVITALDCVPLGGCTGAGVTPGISPAKAEPNRTHVKTIDSKSRFIDFSPNLRFGRCKSFYIEISRTRRKEVLQGSWPITNIRSRSQTYSLSVMRTASLKQDISHLPANEQARLRCQTALELKDKGDYAAAQ